MWLITNNNEWQQIAIDLEKIRENLKNPTLIDNANIEYNAENNNNVEQTETFEVFFSQWNCESFTRRTREYRQI